MTAEELAAGWIEAWQRMDIDWLRTHLAEDFVHTSPFGRLEGRDHYLRTVEPLARKSVAELTVRHVIASGESAAVYFVNRTTAGEIPTCDWVSVRNGRIQSIRSFYDTAAVREALSPEEQEKLGGPGA